MFKLLTHEATLPARATAGSAGYDLYSPTAMEIEPGERAVINTWVSIDMPAGHCGQIWPRSGIALRHGIDVLGGLIDEDYDDAIGVMLINHGGNTVTVHPGDRIAQLVITPYYKSEEVTGFRSGGFGSTGKGKE
ncbi:dUTP diphosphatase [Litorivivens sp.]|uniref:dUTP diphosphatase n=1 Tax=Litorivivens sp. TaxID=2020868 RepID=UPI003563D541